MNAPLQPPKPVEDRAALTLLIAAPRGFCAGVDRAIEIVERALERYGAPVYVRHEIVHNRFVVDGLKAKGAVFVEELEIFRETHSKASLFASYPFSRNFRFDVGTAARRIGFSNDVQRNVYDARTGQFLFDEEEERDTQ